MRVALITEVLLPAVDGVVTRLRHTLGELRVAGDEILVIAPAGGPPDYGGAVVVGMPGLRVPLYPDGVGYARRRDIPLVASYHAHLPTYARHYRLGLLEPVGWRYVRALHNQADLNLCTSRAAMTELGERGVRRLELWPYGVELERFGSPTASDTWRERLSGGHPHRVILLYVGRLAREKELGRLLPAVRDVGGVSLTIVGDGPLRAELERRFSGTATTFHGLLTGAELASAYASADIFVLPSQTETLGIAMLEARAASLPVLAADSATARELIRDGVDGLRFDPLDGKSLASAVRRLVDDPSLRASMGREGHSQRWPAPCSRRHCSTCSPSASSPCSRLATARSRTPGSRASRSRWRCPGAH